jgi:hypothetical protein
LPDDYPIEFVFFYRTRVETARIRDAVQELSAPFWPVFGEYRDGAIWSRPSCDESAVDEVVVARTIDLAEVGELPSSVVADFLAPRRPGALFASRVTQFDDGTAIAFRLSHVVGDGYSYFHLLSTLARTAHESDAERGTGSSFMMSAPTHDRTVLRAVRVADAPDGPIAVERALQIHLEKLPRALVYSTVKEAARSTGVRVSLNDVLCAITVKRLWEIGSGAFTRELAVTIPIDVRAQVSEYGPSYFGNAVWYHQVPLTLEQVASMEIGQIAAAVRQSMPDISTQSYTRHLEELAGRATRENGTKVYDPRGGCLVSNLSQVPLSLLDFGAGAPARILPVLKEKHSASIVALGSDYLVRLTY